MMDNSSNKNFDNPSEEASNRLELSRTFSFWYQFTQDRAKLRKDYENETKLLGNFSTIEQFWCYYQHMVRPDKLPVGSKFAVFHEGIKPAWEDKENQGGGSITLRIKRNFANKFWEDLLLSLIGEQCEDNDAVCGMILNIKLNEVHVSIWTRALDDTGKEMVETWIRKTLGLNDSATFEFRHHPKPTTEETHQKPPAKKFERSEGFRKSSESDMKI